MVEATRSPYILGSCCGLVLSGRENLLEKQLPSHGKGTMEPCSSKPFVGRACRWFSQKDCHSTMLKYKEAQKEPAKDNDYLGQVLPN